MEELATPVCSTVQVTYMPIPGPFGLECRLGERSNTKSPSPLWGLVVCQGLTCDRSGVLHSRVGASAFPQKGWGWRWPVDSPCGMLAFCPGNSPSVSGPGPPPLPPALSQIRQKLGKWVIQATPVNRPSRLRHKLSGSSWHRPHHCPGAGPPVAASPPHCSRRPCPGTAAGRAPLALPPPP